MKKKQIQRYINNFRRRISSSLIPGMGIRCDIFPSESGGAVIVFLLGRGNGNDDVYKPQSPTVNKALTKVRQNAFTGNFDGITFSGTNTILESGRVIFIKDGNHEEWTDSAAAKDVGSVLSTTGRRGG